jgi:phosphate transport system substrate-binding protein
VLKNGDYKDTVKEQPGSASVVQGVTEDRFAIGYSGIGYKTSGVKIVPLSETESSPVSDGNQVDVVSGSIHFRGISTSTSIVLPTSRSIRWAEFTKLIFSRGGQEVVIKDGYMPVSAEIARQELAKIGGGSSK